MARRVGDRRQHAGLHRRGGAGVPPGRRGRELRRAGRSGLASRRGGVGRRIRGVLARRLENRAGAGHDRRIGNRRHVPRELESVGRAVHGIAGRRGVVRSGGVAERDPGAGDDATAIRDADRGRRAGRLRRRPGRRGIGRARGDAGTVRDHRGAPVFEQRDERPRRHGSGRAGTLRRCGRRRGVRRDRGPARAVVPSVVRRRTILRGRSVGAGGRPGGDRRAAVDREERDRARAEPFWRLRRGAGRRRRRRLSLRHGKLRRRAVAALRPGPRRPAAAVHRRGAGGRPGGRRHGSDQRNRADSARRRGNASRRAPVRRAPEGRDRRRRDPRHGPVRRRVVRAGASRRADGAVPREHRAERDDRRRLAGHGLSPRVGGRRRGGARVGPGRDGRRTLRGAAVGVPGRARVVADGRRPRRARIGPQRIPAARPGRGLPGELGRRDGAGVRWTATGADPGGDAPGSVEFHPRGAGHGRQHLGDQDDRREGSGRRRGGLELLPRVGPDRGAVRRVRTRRRSRPGGRDERGRRSGRADRPGDRPGRRQADAARRPHRARRRHGLGAAGPQRRRPADRGPGRSIGGPGTLRGRAVGRADHEPTAGARRAPARPAADVAAVADVPPGRGVGSDRGHRRRLLTAIARVDRRRTLGGPGLEQGSGAGGSRDGGAHPRVSRSRYGAGRARVRRDVAVGRGVRLARDPPLRSLRLHAGRLIRFHGRQAQRGGVAGRLSVRGGKRLHQATRSANAGVSSNAAGSAGDCFVPDGGEGPTRRAGGERRPHHEPLDRSAGRLLRHGRDGGRRGDRLRRDRPVGVGRDGRNPDEGGRVRGGRVRTPDVCGGRPGVWSASGRMRQRRRLRAVRSDMLGHPDDAAAIPGGGVASERPADPHRRGLLGHGGGVHDPPGPRSRDRCDHDRPGTAPASTHASARLAFGRAVRDGRCGGKRGRQPDHLAVRRDELDRDGGTEHGAGAVCGRRARRTGVGLRRTDRASDARRGAVGQLRALRSGRQRLGRDDGKAARRRHGAVGGGGAGRHDLAGGRHDRDGADGCDLAVSPAVADVLGRPDAAGADVERRGGGGRGRADAGGRDDGVRTGGVDPSDRGNGVADRGVGRGGRRAHGRAGGSDAVRDRRDEGRRGRGRGLRRGRVRGVGSRGLPDDDAVGGRGQPERPGRGWDLRAPVRHDPAGDQRVRAGLPCVREGGYLRREPADRARGSDAAGREPVQGDAADGRHRHPRRFERRHDPGPDDRKRAGARGLPGDLDRRQRHRGRDDRERGGVRPPRSAGAARRRAGHQSGRRHAEARHDR